MDIEATTPRSKWPISYEWFMISKSKFKIIFSYCFYLACKVYGSTVVLAEGDRFFVAQDNMCREFFCKVRLY